MRPGDMSTGPAKLTKAWKKLMARWDSVQTDWHDKVSRDFEAEFLRPLDPAINVATEGMRAVTHTLMSAQQEFNRRD